MMEPWPIAARVKQSLPVRRVCGDPACRGGSRLWPWRDDGICLNQVWFCSPRCLEAGARRVIARALLPTGNLAEKRHRIPLGLILLSRGALTPPQLLAALAAQQAAGRDRLGEWLERLGFVGGEQVLAALGVQWACPVLPRSAGLALCSQKLPRPLLEMFHMLPLQFVPARNTLYVGFCQDVHYPALCAVEAMLHCRTEACLMHRVQWQRALTRLEEPPQDEFVFRGRFIPVEMARIVASYAVKLGARHTRLVALGRALWLRLEKETTANDLLFLEGAPVADDRGERASG